MKNGEKERGKSVERVQERREVSITGIFRWKRERIRMRHSVWLIMEAEGR
jgi:hypothetical protein